MKILKGHCQCDAPQTSKDVRRMSICCECKTIGLDLVPMGNLGKMHVRCALLWYSRNKRPGLWYASGDERWMRRVRLCCIGPRRMRLLLDFCEKRDHEARANIYSWRG